jgi:myosin heavy subunit
MSRRCATTTRTRRACEPAMRPAAAHHYLNQSGCTTVSSPGAGGEAGRFEKLCEAMATLGVEGAGRQGAFRTLGAILAPGNVSFESESTGEGETAQLAAKGGTAEGELGAAAGLLGVGADALLENADVLKSFSKRGSTCFVARSAEAAKTGLVVWPSKPRICNGLLAQLV